LNAAVVQAISLCHADKDSVVVVADADHRASRVTELFESLQEAMPGIDPMVSVACVGASCGELGMARAIAPTALACAALRAGEPPAAHALAMHLQSSHDRVVVALAPWRPPAAVQA
jgi:F420-0:gamma-glutamyl ligase-like protein